MHKELKIVHQFHDLVAQTQLRSEEIARDRGAFRNDESLSFTTTGSRVIKVTNVDPSQRGVLESLAVSGLIHRTPFRYVSRGVGFLEATDPYLSTHELIEKTLDHLRMIERSIEDLPPFGTYAALDFAKQSSLLLVNSFFSEYKTKRDLNFLESPDFKTLIHFLKTFVRYFYDYFLFSQLDVRDIKNSLTEFISFIEHFELLYLQNRKNFYLAECTLPLRMISTSASIVAEDSSRESDMQSTRIIGLPCGGTEAALVLQYAFAKEGKKIAVTFLPAASFHSDLSSADQVILLRNQLGSSVNERFLVIDDNTATGTTLRTVSQILEETGAQQVRAYVVEADTDRILERAFQNKLVTLPTSQMLLHASGVLPVTTKRSEGYAHPGRSKVNEESRKLIARTYEGKATTSAQLEEELYWKVRASLALTPTDRLVKKSKIEPNSVTVFQGTPFSNFAPVEVHYGGHSFPSVEHAYQAAKRATYLGSPIKNLVSDANRMPEELRLRGGETLLQICTDHSVEPGTIKRLSTVIENDVEPSQDEKIMIMVGLLIQKFENGYYKEILLGTGDAVLIEGTTWNDRFWGIDADTGLGLNVLGRLLMIIREN